MRVAFLHCYSLTTSSIPGQRMGKAGRIIAMATAHHRFNYIHPFPDGNGRVSRLMSRAMAWGADVAAHGLWSI
jgi:Fic family protein